MKVPSPGVAAFIGFAAHVKLVWFEGTGAKDRSLIDRGVLTTPSFVGPMSGRSTSQPWHADLIHISARL